MSQTTDETLIHNLLQRERDLVTARFKHSMNQLENTAELKVIRRDIAQLRTEARKREVSQGLGKNSLLQVHGRTFGAAAADTDAPAEKGGFLSGIVDKLTGKE